MWIIRYPVPGYVHHIIARFHESEFLIKDERSRERYLRFLGEAMSESDWRCLAYAIMSNHIHLAMFAGDTPADRWTRRVHPPFTVWLNRQLDRFGHVFSGSPVFWVTRPENEARLIAYIHNNPVRAGIVAHARDSSWTSHRAYLGEGRPPWLDVELGLGRAGVNASEFDAMVDREVGYRPEAPPVGDIRHAARKRGAIEIGTAHREPTEVPLLRRRFAYVQPDPQRIVDVVAEVVGVPAAAMRRRAPELAVVDARTLAIQIGRLFGVSISSIAAVFGISPQRGSRLGLRRLGTAYDAAAAVVASRIDGELLHAVVKK